MTKKILQTLHRISVSLQSDAARLDDIVRHRNHSLTPEDVAAIANGYLSTPNPDLDKLAELIFQATLYYEENKR